MFKCIRRLLLIAALCVPWVTQAQEITEYSVTTDTTTFTSIVSTGTAISFSTTDDGYGTVTMPFTMPFGGSTIASGSTIACSANGFLYLGSSSASGTTCSYSSTTYRAVNAILQQDAHIGRYSGVSGAYWQYDSDSPVRSLTIEYHGLGTYSSPYGFYSYQIVFYENGNIEIIYDSVNTGTTTTRTFATYLSDGPNGERLFLTGDWATPTVSNSYATRPNSPVPAHGLRYTFTRPILTCPKPLWVDAIPGTDEMTVYWTYGGEESAWELSLGGSSYYATDTFYTVTNLTPNTVYNFAVRAICGVDDTSAWRTGSNRTLCVPIDTLPYAQNFNDCATGSANLFDPCWSIYNNYSTTSNYPYVTSGYLYVYFYNSSNVNTLYGYAMLPPLDEDLATTDMELVFDIWKSSTASYGSGVIVAIFDETSTPANPVFDTVAIVVPTATSQSAAETHTVYIVDQDLTGKRIGFFYQNQNGATATTYYTYLDNVILREASSCFVPGDLAVNAANADSVMVSWAGPADASAWQVAFGPAGFDPDTVTENLHQVTDTIDWLEYLTGGVAYEVYVRTDCSGDYSYWIGPVAFTPGAINMGVSGSATMNVCNAAIFDDGGASGDYSTSCDYTLTLYPSDSTKRFKFWGSGSTESGYDYLRVYAGAAATGITIAEIAGQNQVIDTVLTQGGPITLQFHSDGSVVYSGFALYVTCVDQAACRDVESVEVIDVSTSSAYISWENVYGTTPLPNSYIVTVYDSTNTAVATVTTPDLFAMVGGLDANYTYTVSVLPSCDESDGLAASTSFTTAAFGCLVYGTTGEGAPVQIGDGTGTSYYLPIGNFYNYSYTQQLFEASELGGIAMPITGISFEYGYTSPTTDKTNVSIYLVNTSATDLSSAFVPYNASTFKLVYTGNLNATNGWNHYQFDSVFNYDGTSNLLVVIHDNSGVYDGSSYVFKTHPATGKGRYVQNDSSPYTLSSVSGGTSVTYRANTKFHTTACMTEATCAAPLFVITGNDTNSVDLVWAAGADETSWTVEHRVAGDATWTVDYASTSLTDANITGLTPNTLYQFRVYHVCGTDTFATVRTVRTDCVGASIPFFENFSGWTTGTSAPVPSCWFKGSDYSTGYPYITTGNSMAGDNNSVYFYASGTTYTYLALPKMDAPIDTLLVTGFVKYSSSGYMLNIGVMTDPEDYSTFHPAGSVATVANQWTPFEVVLAGQPEGNIAFCAGNGGSYVYMYLDNIEVNYFNPCVRPTNVTTSGVTLTTANVSWVDTVTSNFVVEYGPAGFAHGTGTVISVSGNTTSLTGLTHSTMYDVYVRGICGDSDSSNWSFVHQFATSCGTIDSLPFTENFDHWGVGSNVHAPNCWTYGSNYSTTYPYISSSYSHNGGAGSMYMYDGSTAGSTNKTWFALPELDATIAANQTQLLFWTYRSTSSYEHPVMVGVGNNPTLDNTVVWIDTVATVYGQWIEHEVSLDSYTDTGRYIFFATHIGGSYGYSYPYIDDITLEMIPTCPRPDNLMATNATTSTVDLSWHDRANASQWQIEYGPVGFTPGTGTIVNVNSNPYTLTGLPSSYQGEYYVRAVCSATDSGDFSRNPCGFNTTQAPATLPYDYDFEDATEWASWQTSCNSEVYNWYRGTNVADSGNYSMYVASSDSTYFDYSFNAVVNAAAFRDVDFGNIDSSYTFSFRARAGGTVTNYYDGLMVFLVDPAIPTVPSSSNITSPWGNVNDLYRIATMRLDTTWQTYTASFDTIHGVKRVAFFWFNQNTGASYENISQPAAVDNIHIDYAHCPRPVATTVTAMSSTSASLTWTGPASANYEVIYRKTSQTAANNVFLQTSVNSITLTGLEPLTEYAVWVRKLCGSDTSLTSDVLRFTTDMCDNANYYYNYDSTMTSTSTSNYAPIGYSTYNYSYVQTIIDSALLAGMDGDITAFAFNVATASAGDYFTGMDVYLANVSESSLTGFILPDSGAHQFVQVISNGNFNFTTTGWQLFGFDTTFTWDGHSNILVSVSRNHGAWSSGAAFNVHNTTGAAKTYYAYQDSGPISITSPSADYGNTTLSYTGDLMFVTCGISCRVPAALNATNVTYNAATLNWSGSATEYEVSVKAATDATWPDAVTVSNAYSYQVTGLNPVTPYQFRVRAICDEDEGLISDWAMGTFVTDSLPCFDPSNLQADETGYTTATLSWTSNGAEDQWSIHVWNSSFDEEYEANANPFTVTGLTQTTQYYAAVKAVCGNGAAESEYSDTITFTTATCAVVTGVTATATSATTATVNWTSTGATSYEIDYGPRGHGQGSGTIVSVENATSYTITGLTEETAYSVYVRAICDAGVVGNWSTAVEFTTPSGEGINTVDGIGLNIYPNPTSSSTTIALSGVNGTVSVSIVDMNGRVVKSDSMSCEGDCVKTLEVSGLAQGAYFVRVSGDNVNMVKKLVVK